MSRSAKEMIAGIRKVLKASASTLSVRTSASYNLKIGGSLKFRMFTNEERRALVNLHFQDPEGSNTIIIMYEQLEFHYNRLVLGEGVDWQWSAKYKGDQ